MRKLACLLLTACALSSCSRDKNGLEVTQPIPHPIATIQMRGGGVMKFELYPEVVPNTVANFVELAQAGFYDGLIFHRVVPGFVIQGGDPTGSGTGGPGYTIAGEFSGNGYVIENEMSHVRGVISMARSQDDKDSAGSQFFIVQDASTFLDGEYAAFGTMIDETECWQTLDAIASVKPDYFEKPLVEQRIEKITVETYGYVYTAVKIEE